MSNTEERTIDFAKTLAAQVGDVLVQHFREKEPTVRGLGVDIKSAYDKIADDMIVASLEKHFPEDTYLTEETGWVEKTSDVFWVVDPLDGTGNFVNGNPFFSVSIALWDANGPVFGVIHAPMLQEQFFCERGKGAWVEDSIRGRKDAAHVSTVDDLSRAYIVSCEGSDKARSKDVYATLYGSAKDLRKIGSAAIELAWVGAGRAEAFISPGMNLWDIGAGVLFVQEAGGTLQTFDGQPWTFAAMIEKKAIDVVATNGALSFTF